MRARITKRKRAYAEARTIELLAPSPERIAAVADHPGAPWQVLPYERQLEIKAEQVEDALRRIGKLDGFAHRADRARGRAVALPQQGRVLVRRRWRRHGSICGFHAPGSWEDIVDVDDCMLVSERVNEARARGAGVLPRAGARALGQAHA